MPAFPVGGVAPSAFSGASRWRITPSILLNGPVISAFPSGLQAHVVDRVALPGRFTPFSKAA